LFFAQVDDFLPGPVAAQIVHNLDFVLLHT
jgi:hypothetical protein